MINSLIGIPSNEDKVLNKMKKKVLNKKSKTRISSVSEIASMAVRNQKGTFSDKFLTKMEKIEDYDISLHFLNAYISDVELAIMIFYRDLSEQHLILDNFNKDYSSMISFFEKNKSSDMVKKFQKNLDCEELYEEHQKFYNYMRSLALKLDCLNLKDDVVKMWKLKKYFAAFQLWVKLEFYNLRLQMSSSLDKKPLDAKFLEKSRAYKATV